MTNKSNYDKFPVVKVPGFDEEVWTGWNNICKKIKNATRPSSKRIIAVDTYQGVYHKETLQKLIEILSPTVIIDTLDAFLSPGEIDELTYPDVTDDRVFGFITSLEIEAYFDEAKILRQQSTIEVSNGLILVFGPGAALVAQKHDLLIYADMARWEIQQRMRGNEVNNLGLENSQEEFSWQYKRGYFVDWRVCDRWKKRVWNSIDYFLDTNNNEKPKMTSAEAIKAGLGQTITQPFRVVPFFDPGPWGGQWMKEVCDLDKEPANFAWCFDCVPEENSLLLEIGNEIIETPSINLVFIHPMELLGQSVFERFGDEFPIRFDLLDTMGGGNLSFQVHPLTEYIKEKFGMEYTQDESYYMLDTKEGAFVYLGTKTGTDPELMMHELNEAQEKGVNFDADRHVEKWPVKKHDHILIPAGTVHCSGKDSMVLEISATPYIFTFKLWDWGRLGMDGKPRPINIDHGKKVIQWDRTTDWVEKNLINNIQDVAQGEGWREERTGLHELEFIETRRHWFSTKVLHNTNGGVNVLNLVEGREAVVESPTNSFVPFTIHYAETIIIPAIVGEYTIAPSGESENTECATLKAYVRT